jgi:hypothetical protein
VIDFSGGRCFFSHPRIKINVMQSKGKKEAMKKGMESLEVKMKVKEHKSARKSGVCKRGRKKN